MRIGIGVDAHAFDTSRTLTLGGVIFEGKPGLAGFSDADVLLHSITDALLGAAGLGDMGSFFSEKQVPEGTSSVAILTETRQILADFGFRVVNVDSTIVAQSVRIASHAPKMREVIATALEMDTQSISVKATTTDHLGFTGRDEGIAALATALIEQVNF